MTKETSEDTYIKRIQFYLLLCTQTVIVAAFILSDHYILEGISKQVSKIEITVDVIKAGFQDLSVFKESMLEFKTWAAKTADSSIADRSNLRQELGRLNEFRYNIQQCEDELKDLKERVKEHEKETSSKRR